MAYTLIAISLVLLAVLGLAALLLSGRDGNSDFDPSPKEHSLEKGRRVCRNRP